MNRTFPELIWADWFLEGGTREISLNDSDDNAAGLSARSYYFYKGRLKAPLGRAPAKYQILPPNSCMSTSSSFSLASTSIRACFSSSSELSVYLTWLLGSPLDPPLEATAVNRFCASIFTFWYLRRMYSSSREHRFNRYQKWRSEFYHMPLSFIEN